jgi:hypothetical protein
LVAAIGLFGVSGEHFWKSGRAKRHPVLVRIHMCELSTGIAGLDDVVVVGGRRLAAHKNAGLVCPRQAGTQANRSNDITLREFNIAQLNGSCEWYLLKPVLNYQISMDHDG